MTEMTEKQIQIDALRDCVVHWTEVEAAERASDVRIGPGKCALCALYLVDYYSPLAWESTDGSPINWQGPYEIVICQREHKMYMVEV